MQQPASVPKTSNLTPRHGIIADFVETKQAKFIQAIEQATPDALSVTIIDVTQV